MKGLVCTRAVSNPRPCGYNGPLTEERYRRKPQGNFLLGKYSKRLEISNVSLVRTVDVIKVVKKFIHIKQFHYDKNEYFIFDLTTSFFR
ncbi:hypothetical protein RB195_023535 [Necator americanus]|uniref:Uncharacterized protein n=1 Tax=Necator americanus TaxID=51031 RepID=A0ABR1EJM4_NECAM